MCSDRKQCDIYVCQIHLHCGCNVQHTKVLGLQDHQSGFFFISAQETGSSAASVSVSVTPFKVKKETDCKFQTPDSKNDPSEPRKKTAHKSSTTPGSDKDHAEPKEKISRKSKKETLESKDPKEPKKETACSSKSSPGFDKDCDEPSIKEDPKTSLTDKHDIEKF